MKQSAMKTASIVLFVTALFSAAAPAAFADTGLQEVKKMEEKEEQQPAVHKTMKERIAEIKKEEAQQKTKENPFKDEAYIPKDTQLVVELQQELSSKKNRKGDPIQFKLVDNLIVNDVVVAPAGTLVEGRVTKQKSSGLFGRAGKLEISVDSMKTINGVTLPLEYVGRIEAGSDGAVAVAALVSVVGGLFMKGANVKIPAGTKIAVKVARDTDLQTKLTDLKEAMDPNKVHGVSITLQ